MLRRGTGRRSSSISRFDGDESPAQSGDESPHSMECGEFSPLYAGDSSPSNLLSARSSSPSLPQDKCRVSAPADTEATIGNRGREARRDGQGGNLSESFAAMGGLALAHLCYLLELWR